MIMEIYRKSLTGFDIVSASADRKEKFSSKIFYKVFDRYTNLSYKDDDRKLQSAEPQGLKPC